MKLVQNMCRAPPVTFGYIIMTRLSGRQGPQQCPGFVFTFRIVKCIRCGKR